VGVSAPVAEQTQSYSGGLASGVFIAGKRETARVEYELGLDRTTASADDVDVTTDVTSLRLDLLFARAEHPADRQPYLSAGARLYVFESTVYWGEATEVAASVGVGLGVRRPGSGWDVRLDVDLLLETENVRSLVHARCAYRF
jgi:hypothetical protein